MSIRLEMLQVARLAPKLLAESADLVRDFFLARQNGDGGFKDRSGRSDLYYTVFAIDGLVALRAEPAADRVADYLRAFENGEGQDFVHLCCLARAHSALAGVTRRPVDVRLGECIAARVEAHRSKDGGYNPIRQAESGTAYAGFLAVGAYQDLQREVPERQRLIQSFQSLHSADGAWANMTEARTQGSTNATAAVATALRNLGGSVDPGVADWLLARRHPQGGFRAAPDAPIPDLLSTATVLHALAGFQCDLKSIREPCLDFIDTLWTNEGGFHGHWGDDFLDCEYTFYGLLALGHLSL